MTDGFNRILAETYSKAPGESVSIPKSEMPDLPSQFSETVSGTPLWIAHPGSSAQYRASPALHAYELEDRWKIHRDQYDPGENPLGHVLFDAPELWIAAIAAALAGVATYLLLEKREREKAESDRNPWTPILVALGAFALVGIFTYIVAALVRVSLGVG